ncbi:MAG TPA: efflux RND transporter permease subunit [Methylococcaceae bacterium]|nr:efflux RND transporter permease subunit [Methylococcaceae bacterium]
MLLSDLSIRRPVLATVFSLILLLMGAMSFMHLPVREYPDIDAPVVSVRAVLKGASAQVMEERVTQVLEEALSGIEDVEIMKSSSREEVSSITLEFGLERDADGAAADVRDRVARIRNRLPDDVEEPVIGKVDADAQAMMWLAFSSDRHDPLEITDYADRQVQDRLQTLPGVARVMIGGERRYAMRIWLDRERLVARRVTVQDVELALRKRNVQLPSGRIESRWREFTVQSQTELDTPEEFNELVIRVVDGYAVRLSDVGRAELGAADERNSVRVNGNPAVGLGVVKQSTANALAVARSVKAMIPEIERELPEGMHLRLAFDTSRFIEASLAGVYRTLFESLLLVTAVTFLFLRSWRATLIPFVTIPVSLIGAFIFIHALGFSVNILTLLALVLAIGLVVDDAIVVLENIHRRIESGMKPRDAAFEGSREIAFAVIAMTLTLAAVFAPLAFMSGKTGRLFSEFALAVSCAVLVSGFVALTLTPMMCARLLRPSRHEPEPGGETGWVAGYGALLGWVMARRIWVILLFVAVAALGFERYGALAEELAPVEDRSNFIAMIQAPEGATMDYTDRNAREVERMVRDIPELSTLFLVVAPGLERPSPVNSALAFASLQPWEERARKQQIITASLMPKLGALAGVRAFAVNPPAFGQSFRNLPVQFVLQGRSWEELAGALQRLMEEANRFPGLVNLDSDLKLDKPLLSVKVDRDQAADLGVEIDDIGHTLQTLLGGREVTRFRRGGDLYDVIVRLDDAGRTQPDDIGRIYMRGSNDILAPLGALISLREEGEAKELNHFNRMRAVTLSASIAPGHTLGEALDFLEKTARGALPAGVGFDLDGQSREFRDAGKMLYFAFFSALLFIYLVLAAQFESFVDPFIILFTVPLAMTGAVLALHLTGGTLNVYSQVGLVMLIGLVTKNGILIVEFANQLRERLGLTAREAAERAARLRLRPILMTTLTMMLGSVPLALASGAGAEARREIGWVIVGGLLLGTFLTLFVVPVAYVLFGRRRREAVPIS